MRTGWGDRELDLPPHPITPRAKARRQRLSEQFAGERLVDPRRRVQGAVERHRLPVPLRDCAHLSVRQPRPATPCSSSRAASRCSTPGRASSRETDEFFRDRQYGELWAGRRPSLKEISDSLGIETRHLDDLGERLSGSAKTRVLRGADPRVDALVSGDGRPRRRLRPGALRGPPDQGRVGARRAPDRVRHHHARLRGLRARVGPRQEYGRGGSRAPSPAAPAPWATTSGTTRSWAAGGTPRPCTGSTTRARSPPASWSCSTWAPRQRRSTPRT